MEEVRVFFDEEADILELNGDNKLRLRDSDQRGQNFTFHLLVHPEFVEYYQAWQEFEEILALLSSIKNARNVSVAKYVRILRRK